MSPDPTPRFSPNSANHALVEHRSHRRYEIALEVRCRPVGSRAVFAGKTCDISSRSARFQTGKAFPPGKLLQLHIFWPFLLADVRPLQLVMLGRVVRSDGTGTVITAMRHEFRILPIAGPGSAWSERPPDSLIV